MTRDQQDLYRAAECSYARMLRRYVECRLLLNRGYDALKPDNFTQFGFKTISDMQCWVLDIEISRSRVAKQLGFNAWDVVGDRLHCGFSWMKVAENHHLAVETAKRLVREWVAAVFIDHLAHDIPEDYGLRNLAA